MPADTKTDKSPKDKRLEKLQRWWKMAEAAQQEWMIQAKEDLDFYIGGDKQWERDILTILKSQQRPALTYNHLFSLINLIQGYQRQNRQDIMVYNRKGGTKEIADILTDLIKHINDGCFGDWEQSMAFLYGIITGRGWVGLNVDYEDEVNTGDIKIENISPFRVFPDPFSERYDLSDAQYIFKIAWLPKSRLELAFPEKKDEFEEMKVSDSDKEMIRYDQGDEYKDAQYDGTDMSDVEKYRYRVKECTWISFEKQKFIVGTQSGVIRKVDWDEEKIKTFLAQYPTFKKIERIRKVLNLTTYVGDVEIQHVKDPFNGITRFPIVPFMAYFIEGNVWGMITQAKDAQREINKRMSQSLHHLNQSTNSGWIADDNALDDWSDLENFGSRPGMVIKKKPGSFLQRLEPTKLSDGHMKLAQSGKDNIREISGVNPDLAGLPEDKNASGYLMELRRNQGLITVESVFDNFRLTKQILGRTLVDFIQKTDVYTQEEILTLVIDNEVKEIPVNLQRKEETVGRIKNDLTIGKYKVIVSQSRNSATTRMRDFAILMEAIRAGLPIPPDILIDASDIPMKEEIKQRIAEVRNQQVPPQQGGVPPQAGGGIAGQPLNGALTR